LFRIREENAGALGLEPRTSLEKSEKAGEEVDEEEVWDQLRTVYDPEIPVNIVDLGLVYDCQIVTSLAYKRRNPGPVELNLGRCQAGKSSIGLSSKFVSEVLLCFGEIELVYQVIFASAALLELADQKRV
jgi:hypothetical protein